MNALIRWDPFKEMDELQNRITSLFGLGNQRSVQNHEENMIVSQWLPLVDVTEDEKEYQIKVELPEVKKEAVTVTVESGVLSIGGERSFEKTEKDKKYHRIERSYGSFARSFTLSTRVDSDKIRANYNAGVLTITLPKAEAAKPKKIQIATAAA